MALVLCEEPALRINFTVAGLSDAAVAKENQCQHEIREQLSRFGLLVENSTTGSDTNRYEDSDGRETAIYMQRKEQYLLQTDEQ